LMGHVRRLFASHLPEAGGSITLDAEARRHAQVLRLVAGDQLCLFDGAGRQAAASVARVTRQELVCAVQPPISSARRPSRLCLIVCVPKAPKLENIVRMASELGVHAIQLAHSERAVPKLSSESPKLERLRRIALEACAQSEQLWVPELRGPVPLSAAAAAAPVSADKLVFWESATQALSLRRSPPEEPREVWAVVGPEGGIAQDEIHVLMQLGYAPITLGRAILRVDTACIVVSALVLDRMAALR
jgi:16S rRNA (uracil1498-N3)-methyltransferase